MGYASGANGEAGILALFWQSYRLPIRASYPRVH